MAARGSKAKPRQKGSALIASRVSTAEPRREGSVPHGGEGQHNQADARHLFQRDPLLQAAQRALKSVITYDEIALHAVRSELTLVTTFNAIPMHAARHALTLVIASIMTL